MIHHQLSSTINNCYFGGFLDHALMHHHFVLMDCQLFDQSFAINPSHWVLTNYHPRIGCFGTPTTGMEDQDQTDLDNQSTSVDSPSANHSPKPNSKTPQKAQAVCHGTVRRNVVEILQQIVLARKPSTNDRELAHAMLNDRFNLLNLWLGECKSPRFPKVKSQNHEMLAD